MVDHPGDLPSGALLRLAETLAKLELAKLAAKPPEVKEEEPSPADILSLEGLPVDRKLELLTTQRERTIAELHKIDDAIGVLNGDN